MLCQFSEASPGLSEARVQLGYSCFGLIAAADCQLDSVLLFPLTWRLTEALTGRFGEHHIFLARLHLALIDQHTHAIDEITSRIEVVIEPFRSARDLLITVPGISTLVAE